MSNDKLTRIEKNWEHIRTIEKILQESSGDPGAKFNGDIFVFDKSLLIPVFYRKQNKDGSFTKKMYRHMVRARFCPFSGVPLYEESSVPPIEI